MLNHQELIKNDESTLTTFADVGAYRPFSSLRLLPPEDLCLRLLDAVEKAAVASESSMDDLRSIVEEFTVVLKDQGASPEAVLISLKALIGHRTLSSESRMLDHTYGGPVRQHISTWSINAFFRKEASR